MSYLDNSGVSYLWSKIKAAFAPKSHSHAAGDITSGTLPIARGGTGATTAADAVTNIVNGQYIQPSGIYTLGNIEADFVTASTLAATDSIGAGNGISAERDVIAYVHADNPHYLSQKADTGHKHSASDITSGTLPVARGGTGQSTPTSTAVIANVATAGTNCEITQVGYWQWGMVAQLFIAIKVNAAKSSGNVIATLVAGKEPCLTTSLMNTANASQFGAAYANGQIQAKSSLSSGTTVYLVGTYILKP